MNRSVKRIVLPALAGLFLVVGCARDTTSPAAAPPVRAAVAAAPGVAGQYLVLFNGNRVPADLAARVAALGGKVLFSHDGAALAGVGGLTAAAAAQLAAGQGVADVEADDVIQLEEAQPAIDPDAASATPASVSNPAGAASFNRQWDMRAIHADQAWAVGRLGSSAVTVAILDTGIDYTGPDLAGHVDLSRSISFVPSDDALVDAFFPGRNHVTDLHFHGTHVASTVSSNASATAGVTTKTTLIAVKICDVNGSCAFSAIIQGVLWAADHGAAVANMSLGGEFSKASNGRFVALFNRTFNYARANGTLIVAAAGNAAEDMDHNGNTFNTMCSAPNVVCTSATGPTGATNVTLGPWQNVDAPAFYTNFGRSAIDVAAPGGTTFGFVWASCSQTSLVIPICRTGFFILGAIGTSMAAPHASGVAALIAEDVGPNPARIKARLEQSSDDLGQPGTDPFYGKGRVNAAHAVGL